MADPAFPTARDQVLFHALQYLKGHGVMGADQVATLVYPPTNSDMDIKGRHAVVEALKETVPDRHLCDILAALFDPNGDSSRKIVLTRRRRNRPTDILRNSHIVILVWQRLRQGKPSVGERRMNLEVACAEVANEVGLSEEAIAKIWKKNKSIRTALDAPVDTDNGNQVGELTVVI